MPDRFHHELYSLHKVDDARLIAGDLGERTNPNMDGLNSRWTDVLVNNIFIPSSFPNIDTKRDKQTKIHFRGRCFGLSIPWVGCVLSLLVRQKIRARSYREVQSGELYNRPTEWCGFLVPPHHFRVHVLSEHTYNLQRA